MGHVTRQNCPPFTCLGQKATKTPIYRVLLCHRSHPSHAFEASPPGQSPRGHVLSRGGADPTPSSMTKGDRKMASSTAEGFVPCALELCSCCIAPPLLSHAVWFGEHMQYQVGGWQLLCLRARGDVSSAQRSSRAARVWSACYLLRVCCQCASIVSAAQGIGSSGALSSLT